MAGELASSKQPARLRTATSERRQFASRKGLSRDRTTVHELRHIALQARDAAGYFPALYVRVA
jgi:hypothetical protein